MEPDGHFEQRQQTDDEGQRAQATLMRQWRGGLAGVR
jgi:polyphosphate kinase